MIWLDDLREAPVGFTWVKTAADCIHLLERLHVQGIQVSVLSLDHDLGEPLRETGYDVVCWMEFIQATDATYIPPTTIQVHSANPVGRAKMLAGIAKLNMKGVT